MFVRWKRRELKKRRGYVPGDAPGDSNQKGYALSAVLVRSERVDGKVRDDHCVRPTDDQAAAQPDKKESW